MDPNKHLFLEDRRDTFNRFYPYHEEMERLFGVPVYEERKRVGRYLTTVPNLFGNSVQTNAESDSGISSPNLTDSILNSSDASLNSSSNTSGSCSDSSSSPILECFLKSIVSPRTNSTEPTRTTFRDSWLKRSPTPEKRQNATTLHYSLFGDNALDLTSQILKAPAETQTKTKYPVGHKCMCQICNASFTPSVDVQVGANGIDQGSSPDVSMSSSRDSRLGAWNVMEKLHRTVPETVPSSTGFAFPTAARLKKEKPKACKFCKKNGELPEVYNGHETKDITERVTCPILRRYICELCGATGDNAHTRKYCPNYVGFEERLPLFRRLANGVISISHNHK